MHYLPEYYMRIAAELADAFGIDQTIKDPGEIVVAAREKIVELMKETGNNQRVVTLLPIHFTKNYPATSSACLPKIRV